MLMIAYALVCVCLSDVAIVIFIFSCFYSGFRWAKENHLKTNVYIRVQTYCICVCACVPLIKATIYVMDRRAIRD